jgi:UDP-N-acetylmuramate--L-alanine ligase/UDP-N-acetylenolpyruvoylglucosamine reductase
MRDYDEQRVIAEALAAGIPGRAHLMGIGGVGVAGLATLLAARQWTVDGCDAALNPLTARAQAAGLAVAPAHAPAHLAPLVEARRSGSPVCVIRSTAITDEEPEIAAARAAGIPVLHRGVALAAWVSAAPHSVAVCGAHGKTTTSLFATRLFQELGHAVEWCLGGEAPGLGAGAGRSGGGGVRSLVVEADESDGTLALYRPHVTVVTNIDIDHLEHFAGIEDLVACYRRVVAATRSGVAWCADNPLAAEVCGRVCDGVHAVSFGFSETAWLRASDVVCGPDHCAFTVCAGGRPLGGVVIGVPGRHNILNALGALAAAVASGVPPGDATGRLAAACAALPNRRFETVAQVGGARVIVDYAHHPEEIRALIAQTLGGASGRITAVFQPHRYTRTLALRDAFPAAFDGADRVILMPVYAASEQPLAGGSAEDLYAAFRRLRPAMRVLLADTHDEAWHAAHSGLAPDDVLLVVGAGDVVTLASRARAFAADATPPPTDAAVAGAPLGRMTTFGVGGSADWFMRAGDEATLARALAAASDRGMPVQVLGGGSNTLVADGGVAGLVVRLSGPVFQRYERVGGGEVEVGCGLAGSALLDRLEADGLAGLECLEGVPGMVGGWLAMNAGAHGGSIGVRVSEIRCLSFDGTPAILSSERCGFGYRRCVGLRGRVALSVRFRLDAESPGAVRQRRDAFRLRRTALDGLRTAGSVFRNPDGDFAGRLLEAAGCKAMRVGGAAVFGGHANVIVAGAEATASDVLALMRLMAGAVDARWGVRLTPELRLLK